MFADLKRGEVKAASTQSGHDVMMSRNSAHASANDCSSQVARENSLWGKDWLGRQNLRQLSEKAKTSNSKEVRSIEQSGLVAQYSASCPVCIRFEKSLRMLVPKLPS
jgi:hypothetical protein